MKPSSAINHAITPVTRTRAARTGPSLLASVWGMVLLGAALAGAAPTPVQAGDAEIAYLQSYTGGWKGKGQLKGGERNEDFICRLNVTPGNSGKINYAGRCSVAGLNLSVAGTIAYIDDKERFEAAMTSSAVFAGTAIGRKQGNGVVFDLKEAEKDKEGRDMTISSQVSLQNDAIGLKFHYLMKDTGDETDAAVVFSRMKKP